MNDTLLDKAFVKVKLLSTIFRTNENRYLSPAYQEAEVRKDFIDKFFAALGWDVNHDEQTDPYAQEVKVERGVETRTVDYAFFLKPNYRDTHFLVEAKKPSKNIENPDFYFQTIRYGYNANCPVCVLTDFEQFHILDCRHKPDIESALSRCLEKFTYSDYADRDKFARIYWLFSREAVTGGSLNKFAESLPKPRGKARQRGLLPSGYKPVDESLLEELDEFRVALAKTFKAGNPNLNSETLTELAQRVLDRLVFMRFLEDKLIEPQPIIDKFGKNGVAWHDFNTACRRLDGIYNGIVFKQHGILDAPGFRVDNDEFFKIVKEISRANSPYDFNSIPIHILGSIYERFLGKVIVATDKRVRIEDKPEVRKAGGVYYTPEYIVRYIVENTVGKLIAGKTPEQIAGMRFADIACGSGSFLLGVYDLLLQYHGNYYNANPKKAKKGDCIERDGKLYLSLGKKREILLNNIYGVDIDAQAVEVCQLSLYLKLLAEETTASAHQYLLDFERQALLPTLTKNIVCGNSLIGTDILEGKLFAGDEEKKLNPMNFEDAFPEIMKGGGFDAIVGNPPYVQAGLLVNYKPYFQSRYKTFTGNADLYVFFIERALNILKLSGKFGYVVSNKWLRSDYGRSLRQYLSCDTNILGLVDFGELPVFRGVGTFPCIIFCSHRAEGQIKTLYTAIKSLPPNGEIADQVARHGYGVDLKDANNTKWTFASQEVERVLRKLRDVGVSLETFCKGRIRRGVLTGYNPAFIIDKATRDRLVHETPAADEVILPFVSGDETRRYSITWGGRYIILSRHGIDIRKYPSIAHYLEQFQKHLEPKKNSNEKVGRKPGNYRWYEIQDSTAYFHDFEKPKIIYGQFQIAPHFSFSPLPMCFGSNHYMIVSDDTQELLYLCGILNSGLYFFYMKRVAGVLGDADDGGRLILQKSHILEFPMRANPVTSSDKACHDEIVTKVEAMLEAKKQLAAAKTDKDKNYYEAKCAGLDRQIDRLVYDLYGLTADEIKLVEESASR